MADKPILSDDDLIDILRKEESAATSYQTGTLSAIRVDANNYYDRQPYGDEQEGSSKVVTSEFADVIESTMPGLMEVFAGGDQIVQFTPTHPGDEQYMQEASDYVGHCFMQRNKGFLLLSASIKDALMSRLGGINVDLEDRDETRTVQAQGLTQDAIDLIVAEAEKQGAELEMDLAQDNAAAPPSESNDLAGPVELGMPAPLSAPITFSGTVTITRRRKVVVCDTIAPEDIRFTPTARDQDKCSYLGFVQETSASDLVKLGVSQDEIDELNSERPNEPEENQRTDSASAIQPERNEDGDSEKKFWLVVAYVKADFRGNGTSSMERVLYAHAGGVAAKIIEREEWDGPASIALASPILMPHSIVGRSMFDQTKDVQQIKSVLTRGLLDNLYVANRPRPAVSDQVILDSVLDWVPGSPIRFKQGAKPGDGHIDWQQPPSVMNEALAALEYFSTVTENRTGTNRANQGLDADSLNKTARGMNLMESAKSQRQKLIARVLAETFVARVYRLVYRAIKRAATGPESYWAGDTFKTVDPTKWPDDVDLTVNVGLGTGNTQQELEHLSFIAQAQEKLVTLQGGTNGPFVTAENVANLANKMSEKLGFKTQGMFFQPPEKVAQTPPAEPPKDPKMAEVEAKIMADQAAFQADQQLNQQKLMADIEAKRQQAAIDMQLARERAAQELQIAREKAALDMQIAREKAALDAQLKARELEQEAALGALEIKTNAEVQGAAQQREQEVS
jgi:hypothetical protein